MYFYASNHITLSKQIPAIILYFACNFRSPPPVLLLFIIVTVVMNFSLISMHNFWRVITIWVSIFCCSLLLLFLDRHFFTKKIKVKTFVLHSSLEESVIVFLKKWKQKKNNNNNNNEKMRLQMHKLRLCQGERFNVAMLYVRWKPLWHRIDLWRRMTPSTATVTIVEQYKLLAQCT